MTLDSTAEIIDNGLKESVEVYTHDIFQYADEFVFNSGYTWKDNKEDIKEDFPSMIYYIRDRIQKPSHDIKLLDSLFDIYVVLCRKCHIIPTLEAFSWLVSMSNATFSDWSNGEYRKATPEYSKTVKKWFNICKGHHVFTLNQRGGTDANRIFIAKAVYGMAETAPVTVSSLDNRPEYSQIAANMGLDLPGAAPDRQALPGAAEDPEN